MGVNVGNRKKSKKETPQYVIGIDEAGRGPLAGPIVVAGVALVGKRRRPTLGGIRDSKKLSAKKREEWFRILTSHPRLRWRATRISPKVIDRINIARAADRGALRVWRKLAGRHTPFALLDGSLYLPKGIPHQTLVKGDERVPVIAAASIIAKVVRDRTMMRLHKKYPHYRFDLHKGYATKLHRALVKKFGRSRVHRRSFRI